MSVVPETADLCGRWRVALPILRTLFVVGLPVGLAVPVMSPPPPQEPGRIGPTERIGLHGGGSAPVPERWPRNSIGTPLNHVVLALATSNNEDAVGSVHVGGIRREELTPADAYVVAFSVYLPTPPTEPRSFFPGRLSENNATVGSKIFGRPTLSWMGEGADGNGSHSVVFWIGPAASPSVEAQARLVLDHLDFPPD